MAKVAPRRFRVTLKPILKSLDQPPLSFVDITNRNELSLFFSAKKRWHSCASPFGLPQETSPPPPESVWRFMGHQILLVLEFHLAAVAPLLCKRIAECILAY